MSKTSLPLLQRRAVLISLIVIALSGCASTRTPTSADSRDPLEPVNRVVFNINQKLDHKIFQPIAQKYKDHMPAVAQTCVSNVFANFADIGTTANQLLQGHPGDATSDASRVAVNSTVGVFGCFDPATSIGLEKHKKDFGGTLAVWGVPAGPFLELPILGASDIRDTAGLIPGSLLDPVGRIKNVPVRVTVDGTRLVAARAGALNADGSASSSPTDAYQASRDTFFAKRIVQIEPAPSVTPLPALVN